MFNRFFVSALASATILAGTVGAQSIPAGYYVDGEVYVGYLSDVGGGSADTGFVDVAFGYDGSAAGSIPFGFEFGMQYFSVDGIDLGPIYSGIIFYDTDFGRFSVGTPDSVLDDLVPVMDFAGSKYYALVLSPIFQSSNHYYNLLTEEKSYGVRFDGNSGNLSYGLSYNDFSSNGGPSIYAGAVSYEMGNFVAAVGFEKQSDVSETGVYGMLGFDYGKFSGQLNVSNPVIATDNFYSLEVSYAVMDSLLINAGILGSSGAGSTNPSFVGAEYSFMGNGYVGANAIFDGPAGSGSTTYNIYAGWNLDY